MIMEVSELKIDTAKAFWSISIDILAMQRLCQGSKNRRLLESYGIDPRNFDPVISSEIDVIEWVKILIFYEQESRYKPAKNILAGLKKIIIS
jgi:hypothetical protein